MVNTDGHATVTAVTDSGANVKKALANMAVERWRPCFAHTLQLCVNGSLTQKEVSELPKIMAKARAIVGHFRRSPLATTQLERAQQQLDLPRHKLLQDCATRWNSQCVMLERLLEQRDAVSLVLASVPTVKNLSAQQWSTAAELTSTLRPFLEVTTLMSGASYPTISMIVPVVDGLQHLLKNTAGGLDVLRSVLARMVQDKFGDGDGDDQLCVATVVDPRFKLAPFDHADRRQRAVETTVRAMEKMMPSSAASAPTPDQSTAVVADQPAAPLSLWSKLDMASTQAPTSNTTDSHQDILRRELQQHGRRCDTAIGLSSVVVDPEQDYLPVSGSCGATSAGYPSHVCAERMPVFQGRRCDLQETKLSRAVEGRPRCVLDGQSGVTLLTVNAFRPRPTRHGH